MKCFACGSEAKGGHKVPVTIGDRTDIATVVICDHCGGYKLNGTAERLIELGTLKMPSPEKFAEIVRGKRGDSADYPLITEYDLGG